MNAKTYQQPKTLLHAAMELGPAERAWSASY